MQTSFKRPYATHYYNSESDRISAYVSHGACSTDEGAIRASVWRVFRGQYQRATIHDRATGAAMYTISKKGSGIRVSFGSGVAFKQYVEDAS